MNMPLNRGICCPQAVVDQLTTCVGSLPADQEPRWTLDEAGGRRSPCRGARPARRHLPPARGRRSRRPARRHRCPASPRLRASARLGSARLGSARRGPASHGGLRLLLPPLVPGWRCRSHPAEGDAGRAAGHAAYG